MTIFTRSSSERATAKAALGGSIHWRRTVRRIVGEHRAHAQGQLGRCLDRTVNDVVALPSGGLTIVVPGYRLHLADVCGVAQHRMLSMSRGPCQLTAGGRYGRFWWLTISQSAATASPSRATALGSLLSVVPSTSGHDDSDPEARPHPSRRAPVA